MKNRKILLQVTFGVILALLIGVLTNNLIINLIRSDLTLSLDWLFEPSGFEIAEHSFNYSPSDSNAWALFTGWINSVRVIFLGLICSTIIGLIASISSISNNIILRSCSKFYITIIRQIPLLIQLFFWYFVGFLSLASIENNPLGYIIGITNSGIEILGFKLSLEYTALLVGLSIYTSASISELIRGGLDSVKKGQWEAFRSLGINDKTGIRKIIIPQSLPAIIPGLTSQYLNLAKNSTLAIAIGYTDIYAASDTIISETGRAIEVFAILMISFFSLNILISTIMEFINRLVSRTTYQ